MDAPGLLLYELAGADPAVRFSPHCWKARMALAHKGLSAETVPWRFSETGQIAFSGQKLVPVLVDGDAVVSDSWAIACHLEERYPERPSLFGAASAVPLARFVNAWADTTLAPAITRVILLDIFGRLDDGDRDYFRRSREQRFGMPLEDVAADRSGNLAAVRAALRPLQKQLTERPYVCGEQPGYADYCVFGMFMWARLVGTTDLLAPDDPVASWRERLLDAFGGVARDAPAAAGALHGR